MSVLIKNGRVVTAVDDYFADVFVDGETVAQIGKDLAVDADGARRCLAALASSAPFPVHVRILDLDGRAAPSAPSLVHYAFDADLWPRLRQLAHQRM